MSFRARRSTQWCAADPEPRSAKARSCREGRGAVLRRTALRAAARPRRQCVGREGRERAIRRTPGRDDVTENRRPVSARRDCLATPSRPPPFRGRRPIGNDRATAAPMVVRQHRSPRKGGEPAPDLIGGQGPWACRTDPPSSRSNPPRRHSGESRNPSLPDQSAQSSRLWCASKSPQCGGEAPPHPRPAHIRGSAASRSDPGVNSTSCWWVSASRTSPTMPKWSALPSNCSFKSTR